MFKTNMNLPKRIREIQRQNEADLLKHLRESIKDGEPLSSVALLGNAWIAALERLEAAKKVRYIKPRRGIGHYAPVRYARPVTNAN